MKNYNAKNVGAYIAGADREARPKLKELRKIIKSTVPEATEGIGWGVPIYKYHGVLAGFVALKKHVDFGLVTVLQNKDRRALEKRGYRTGSKTIQIKFDQKIPVMAIRRILKIKAKNNKAGKAKK